MIDRILISKILDKIKRQPGDYQAYEDLFSVCRNEKDNDLQEALTLSTQLRSLCEKNIPHTSGNVAASLIGLVN